MSTITGNKNKYVDNALISFAFNKQLLIAALELREVNVSGQERSDLLYALEEKITEYGVSLFELVVILRFYYLEHS
jgi:hypothetical protein